MHILEESGPDTMANKDIQKFKPISYCEWEPQSDQTAIKVPIPRNFCMRLTLLLSVSSRYNREL